MEKEGEQAELVEKIAKKTGKSREEVLKKIGEKKSKFSGLLTDSGAAFMVAKELGVHAGKAKKAGEKTKINGLKEGMNGLEMPVRVLHIYSPKEYEKNDKKGKYCRLLAGDETGEISLTLWGSDVDRLEREKIQRGAVLLLKGAFVSTYKEKLQLGIPRNGEIEVLPESGAGTLPKPEKVAIKLSDLGEGMENLDVFARIIRIFEVKEFTREGEKRKVVNFIIGDDTGQARATAWNELAERVNRLEAGDLVKIEGAYTKKGLKGTELHLGWNSRVLLDPKIGFKIPELESLSKRAFERKKISELKEGDEAELFATITGIHRGALAFRVCPNCGKKVETAGNGFVCEKCGQVENPKNRLVLTAIADDGSGAIRASVFGRNAEKLIEKSTPEITKLLEEKTPEEIIEGLSMKAIGKNCLLSGSVKKSKLNPEELELSASVVRGADTGKEIKKIMQAIKVKGK